MKHGVGKWRTILKDPEFSSTLYYRSNVDLKDKWRNMNVIVSASGSCDKGKTAVKKTQATPKTSDHTMPVSIVPSDIDDEIVDEKPIASVSSEARNTSNPKKSHSSRLDNIIMDAIKNLNEPTGSHRTTISSYIEEQYWPLSDFDHLLSAKLKDLATSGKLVKVQRVSKQNILNSENGLFVILALGNSYLANNLEHISMWPYERLQVNRMYRIAPTSPYSEGRSPKMLLLEDVQREPFKVGSDDSKTLTKSQVDTELARMATMIAEEAAAAAAHAVAEAETIMAEAEAAAREAEAAEADAQAAQAFAEAAFLILKNRNSAKLMAQA